MYRPLSERAVRNFGSEICFDLNLTQKLIDPYDIFIPHDVNPLSGLGGAKLPIC